MDKDMREFTSKNSNQISMMQKLMNMEQQQSGSSNYMTQQGRSMAPYMSPDDLRDMLRRSENIDRSHFLEQRKNILLVAGKHYLTSDLVTGGISLDQNNKIQITQNHLQYIADYKTLELVKNSPNVQILPNNDGEAQDVKAAQLFNSVWQYIVYTNRLRKLFNRLAKDFIELGEACVLIKWNDTKGFKLIDEENEENQWSHISSVARENGWGDPNYFGDSNYSAMSYLEGIKSKIPSDLYNKINQGMPQDKLNTLFLGDFDIQRVFPMNVIRPAQTENMDEAEWLGIISLVSKKWLTQNTNIQYFPESGNGVGVYHQYFVFQEDAQRNYDIADDKVKVMEIFWRPTPWLPYGWYCMFTENQILIEDQLPYGIFPLIYVGYLSSQTAPRHFSLIRHLIPFQQEINRCATEMVRHQIATGSDKVLLPSGSKLSRNTTIHGVKGITYTGLEKPTLLKGTVGEQFYQPLMNQIEQMYHIANVPYRITMPDGGERQGKAVKDPFAQLFESMKQQDRSRLYSDDFEIFLQDICRTTLNLARYYLDERSIIPMIGRAEMVNITEFKNMKPLDQMIKALPRSDDVNTVMGKQLVLNQALQYTGNKLDTADIGNVILNMPLINDKKIFKKLTIDHESADNMILALDRGDQFQPNQFDNAPFMINQLTLRMRQADFKFLPPQVQQGYQQVLQSYQQIIQKKQQEVQKQNMGIIPTDGPTVRVDKYIPYKKKDGKTVMKKALYPYSALAWLDKRLEDQQTVLDQNTMQSQNEEMLDRGKKAQEKANMQGQQPQQPQMPRTSAPQ